MAVVNLGFAAIVFTWKTVGMGLVPGFEDIWGGPQYPRRNGNEWNLLYLPMYGILGMAAQWAGLQLSFDEENRGKNNKVSRNRAKLLGLFHVALGAHHVLWASMKNWGRLNLDRFNIPGAYFLEGLAGLITGYHGAKLLFTKESDSFDQIIYHKTLVDASTDWTLISYCTFLPAQWFDYSNFTFERSIWLITAVGPLTMFACDFFTNEYLGSKK